MGDNVIGIIGGSGIYDISGLTKKLWQQIDSPYSEASDELPLVELGASIIVVSTIVPFDRRIPLLKRVLVAQGKNVLSEPIGLKQVPEVQNGCLIWNRATARENPANRRMEAVS